MVFRSKRDTWITTMMATAAMSMIAIACHLMFAGDSPTGFMAVALLGSAHLTIWCMHDTSYELGPSAVVIRCGPITKTIAIDAVYEVFPTTDITSAPALSADRLQIGYKSGGRHLNVLISPERKEDFLGELGKVIPELEFQGMHAIHRDHLMELAASGLVVA